MRVFHGCHFSWNEIPGDKLNYSVIKLSLHLNENKIFALKHGCNKMEMLTNLKQQSNLLQGYFAKYMLLQYLSLHLSSSGSPLLN